jgi:hypothetical protein
MGRFYRGAFSLIVDDASIFISPPENSRFRREQA